MYLKIYSKFYKKQSFFFLFYDRQNSEPSRLLHKTQLCPEVAIENVEIISVQFCRLCGSMYLDLHTFRKLDKIPSEMKAAGWSLQYNVTQLYASIPGYKVH